MLPPTLLGGSASLPYFIFAVTGARGLILDATAIVRRRAGRRLGVISDIAPCAVAPRRFDACVFHCRLDLIRRSTCHRRRLLGAILVIAVIIFVLRRA
jgi:hypothetical protein